MSKKMIFFVLSIISVIALNFLQVTLNYNKNIKIQFIENLVE